MTTLKTSLASWKTRLHQSAIEIGHSIDRGLTIGINSGAWSPIQAMQNLVNRVIATANNAAQTHSPSVLTIQLGQNLAFGLNIGLENGLKKVENTAQKGIKSVVSSLSIPYMEYTNIGFSPQKTNQAIGSNLSVNAYVNDIKDLATGNQGQNMVVNYNVNGGYTSPKQQVIDAVKIARGLT
jgi:hypothetical protein